MNIDLESQKAQESQSQIPDFDVESVESVESVGENTSAEDLNSSNRTEHSRSICSNKFAGIMAIGSLFLAIALVAGGIALIWRASNGDIFYGAEILGGIMMGGAFFPFIISILLCSLK